MFIIEEWISLFMESRKVRNNFTFKLWFKNLCLNILGPRFVWILCKNRWIKKEWIMQFTLKKNLKCCSINQWIRNHLLVEIALRLAYLKILKHGTAEDIKWKRPNFGIWELLMFIDLGKKPFSWRKVLLLASFIW